MRVAQRRVAVHPDDRVVYLAVDREIVVELAAAVVTFHPNLKGAEAGELAVGRAIRGEFGSEPLDSCERLEQFRDAFDRDVGDARAAVRAKLDQSLGGENFHRLC